MRDVDILNQPIVAALGVLVNSFIIYSQFLGKQIQLKEFHHLKIFKALNSFIFRVRLGLMNSPIEYEHYPPKDKNITCIYYCFKEYHINKS